MTKPITTSKTLRRRATAGALAAMALAAFAMAGSAHAQLGDMLKNPLGGGSTSGTTGGADAAGGLGSALGGLGGSSSLSSLTSGSTGNVAGILEYCVKNNYLGGDAASATGVKDKLLGKLGGTSAASSDSGYLSGAKGLLQSSDGKQVDIGGGGLKAQITKQVCDKILAQGKSLL